MSIHFNADELLAMAEQIERNGAAFYRRASEITKDDAVRAHLLELAEWETGHERLFTTMRSHLSEQEKAPSSYDPNGDAILYAKEMADRHVFNMNKDAAQLLKGHETPEQILDLAIGFERDTILFFEGMASFVPASLGKDKVTRLIQEEMGHVAFLSREKARIMKK